MLSSAQIRPRLTVGCCFMAGKKVCQRLSCRVLLSICLAGSVALAKQRTIDYNRIIRPAIAISNRGRRTKTV